MQGETPACPAAAVSTVTAGVPVLDWTENAGFDAGGALWVSRTARGVVERYDAAGAVTRSVAVELPGAVRLGPDGLLYVTTGNFPTSASIDNAWTAAARGALVLDNVGVGGVAVHTRSWRRICRPPCSPRPRCPTI